ncbi:MAG: PQQ-dependent sugar dehydrogenase [Cyclobacteriaceae bacterium]
MSVFGQADQFDMEVVGSAEMLTNPWEVIYGPDDMLWITERQIGKVVKVDPSSENPSRIELLTIPDLNPADIGGQCGLLGMALHPNLGKGQGNDFVYLAYTYGEPRQLKIVRYTYETNTLIEPIEVISGLPAATSHNSGRLIIGPDLKLYYTIGDQGANQYRYTCNETLSQHLPTQTEIDSKDYSNYPGKVLRINLDGSIPDDNPILNGVQSHVFTYGHRNAQGLVFSSSGMLYSDEHGPKSDDEINLLIGGKNYGWPHVAGYQDDQAYDYCKYFTLQDCENSDYDRLICPAGVDSDAESSWSHPDFMEPIQTMYTVPNDYDFGGGSCGSSNICWPTIAPSSIDFYEGNEISGWDNSLIVTSMKVGRIFRYKLSDDGTSIVGEPMEYFNTQNRYRDIALSPNGKTFYIITDNDGSTIGLSGAVTSNLHNKGSILKFELAGPKLIVRLKDRRGRPINGALATLGEMTSTSNSQGTVEFEVEDLVSTSMDLIIEHVEYFKHVESITVENNDVELDIVMIENKANVTFLVTQEGVQLQNALVKLNQEEALTDATGKVVFLDKEARKQYNYLVELSGREAISESFLLGGDTTITISMVDILLTVNPADFFLIYPNPAEETLYVEGVNSYSDIMLINIQGKVLRQFKAPGSSFSISVGDLNSGMYFLQVEGRKMRSFLRR